MAHVWDDVVHTCEHQRIFCNEACVDRWLEETGNERGALFDLATLWRLASQWYAGRLDTIALAGTRRILLARIGTVPGAAGGLDLPSLSRDARTLLVMAADGTALLYDIATGERIGEPFRIDAETLAPAVLRPDGLEMAISMPEGVVVWDIDPDHQFGYVCRMAGRDLTDNEWRTYLPEFGDRQSTCADVLRGESTARAE